MEHIFIDLTSKNNQFICVEDQGSWLFHRFGKRRIDNEELDFNLLKKYLKKESPKQITLYSILGDPMEYSRILDLLFFCKRSDIVVNINCNGFSKKIKDTLGYDIEYCFKIYGYKNTLDIIVPNADKTLFKNLNLDFKIKPKIQYMLYDHNLCDVKHIIRMCEEKKFTLEIHPGVCVYNNLNHVIDQQGKWLYDIKGVDEYDLDIFYKPFTEFKNLKKIFNSFKQTNYKLSQTNEGWHLLKNYVKDTGISILDASLPNIQSNKSFKKIKCISYKGHIFDNIESFTVVTNAYIPDWTIQKFNTRDSYQENIFEILCEFSNSEKLSIESLL